MIKYSVKVNNCKIKNNNMVIIGVQYCLNLSRFFFTGVKDYRLWHEVFAFIDYMRKLSSLNCWTEQVPLAIITAH